MQVLKKDWPARWPNFIPEIVGASKTSESLCENSMHILRLLSEEVFDFNRGELTQAKTRMLKSQLNAEFRQIHELCHFVLSSTDLWTSRPNLIKATLSALQVSSAQLALTLMH
jgi:exportin-1